jgi:hypothetical protein
MMTEQEIIDFFKTAVLPETLRIDRATTQHHVAEADERNIGHMVSNPKDGNAKHRLTQIMNAILNPYNGPEIPNR